MIPTPGVRRSSVDGERRRSSAPAASRAGTLIPILKSLPGVTLSKVCTASGLTARDMAIRHGFMASVGDPDDILRDDATNIVFIATRHD